MTVRGLRALAAAAALSLGLAGRAGAQTAAASATREIAPLLDAMMAAANAHDTDRFLASYLHDTSLVMVFNGSVIAGYDSVRALQLKWWNNGRSDVAYAFSGPLRYTVLGPAAAVTTFRLHAQRTDSTGARRGGDLAVTSVWQKRPEGWRIVAVHESTDGR